MPVQGTLRTTVQHGMDKITVITVLLLAAFCAPFTIAQRTSTPLDRYLDEATNILVVRCIKVGPVNILLRARVDVEVLQVVKGDETLKQLSVISQVAMQPEKLYLIRTTGKTDPLRGHLSIDSYDSAIPISDGEDLEILKTLSPRIVVLRTMNLRADRLRSKISLAEHELKMIDDIRAGN
jgi:hypothetical protein